MSYKIDAKAIKMIDMITDATMEGKTGVFIIACDKKWDMESIMDKIASYLIQKGYKFSYMKVGRVVIRLNSFPIRIDGIKINFDNGNEVKGYENVLGGAILSNNQGFIQYLTNKTEKGDFV